MFFVYAGDSPILILGVVFATVVLILGLTKKAWGRERLGRHFSFRLPRPAREAPAPRQPAPPADPPLARPTAAAPEEALTECPYGRCRALNHKRARYCRVCGTALR